MSAAPKPRGTRTKQQPHTKRLLAILEANLAQARSPALRERLARAIKTLREKKDAAA